MTTKTRALAITVALAVPAFLLGPVLWPVADTGVEPTSGQLPFFLFLAVGDALLFGAGIAFVALGFPLVRRLSGRSRLRAWTMYVAISYLMVSWWPHLNMHNSNGMDLSGLLVIDYLFHFPLEVAAVALGISFWSLHRERQASRAAREAGVAPVPAPSAAR